MNEVIDMLKRQQGTKLFRMGAIMITLGVLILGGLVGYILWPKGEARSYADAKLVWAPMEAQALLFIPMEPEAQLAFKPMRVRGAHE